MGIKLNDNIGLKGQVKIINHTTGKIETYDNVVVNVGKLHLLYLAGGNSAAYFDWLGFGTSTSTPAATDTALGAEVSGRVQVASKSYTAGSSPYMEFTTTVLGSEQVGTWRELGMFSASSGGTMLSRLGVNYTHNLGEIISIVWRWTLS